MYPSEDTSSFELTYRRFAQILGMADAVSLRNDPASLFRELAPRLRSIIPFDFINFALHDSHLGKMKVFLWDGGEWPAEPMLVAVNQSEVGAVWQSQAAFSIGDLEGEANLQTGLLCIRDRDLRAYCVLPLTTPKERIGALGFGSRSAHAFSPHDILFLRRVAEMVALCMDHSLAEAALSLVPLVSTSGTASASPVTAKATETCDHSLFSDRDIDLLKQLAATLVPLIEQGRTEQPTPVLSGLPACQSIAAVPPMIPASLKKALQQAPTVQAFAQTEQLEEIFLGLFQDLKAEKKRRLVTAEVSYLLSAQMDVPLAVPKLSAYLRRILRHEYAALSLRNDSGALVVRAIDFPLQKHLSVATDPSVPQDPRERALQQRTPIIFARQELLEMGCAYTSHLLQEGLQSLCCVPLVRPQSELGVLVLGSTRASAFGPDDLDLLKQVAAQLAIALENDLASRQLEQLKSRSNRERGYLKGELRSQPNFQGLIGESSALQSVLNRVSIVAETTATVLLLGETGTGKGVVARALHQGSRRKHKNFVTLNCAAIPTGLLESELFGHEKGAFTGALSQKFGRLETADGGTLFLDEIGEIPAEVQPKLLRVLQDREFERLGGTRTIKVDVRLIAATNRDLAKSVLENQFRSDLFYRLNVFPVRIPPLRERREDIPLLVRHFVHSFCRQLERSIETIPTETMNALVNHSWPGNVRELENFIERSVILTEGTALKSPLAELLSVPDLPDRQSLEHTERSHIVKVLRETGGLISGPFGAAQRLGLKRTTLQSKIERLGITADDYSNSFIA